MKSDVLIIGAGVIGLSLARELHRKGAGKVRVIDRGLPGREASFAAAGMLAPQAETDETGDFFDLCTASRDLYPRFAEELFDEIGIDIELDQTGTLYAAFTDSDAAHVRDRHSWQINAGLNVERLTARESIERESGLSPAVLESLFFPNDWQVENRRLIAALVEYAAISGVELLPNERIDSLLIDSGRVVGASSAANTYFADTVVLATGAWTSFIKIGGSAVSVPVKPMKGQLISFQLARPALRHVVYSPRGYIVPRRDGRILAGSTCEDAGFDTAPSASVADALREKAAEIAPVLAVSDIADTWAGLRPFASNGMPVLGGISGLDGLMIATGHFRNGILLAPLTAQLLASKMVDGSDSRFLSAFAPERRIAGSTVGN